MPLTHYAGGMEKLKVIRGERSLLEQELVRALFTGETETFDRINLRLSDKASLSLCQSSRASNRGVQSTPHQSDEEPA